MEESGESLGLRSDGELLENRRAPIYWIRFLVEAHVVYLGSFLWIGAVGDVSAGRPIGGSGGGIPRLLDMMMTSAKAILETAWITCCGGGLFFLCSSVISTTSDRSPVTWAFPLTLSWAIEGV